MESLRHAAPELSDSSHSSCMSGAGLGRTFTLGPVNFAVPFCNVDEYPICWANRRR